MIWVLPLACGVLMYGLASGLYWMGYDHGRESGNKQGNPDES